MERSRLLRLARAFAAFTALAALAALAAPLALAASARAHTVDSSACMPDTAEFFRRSTATIRGHVRVWPGGQVLAYANIGIPAQRRRAMTDEDGGFRFAGLAPGRCVLEVHATGFHVARETLDVAAGEERTFDFRVTDTHALLRDSLERIGRWPPTLDAALDARLGAALTLRVRRFQSDPDYTVPQDWRVWWAEERTRGRPLPLAWRDSLLAALRAADFASPMMGVVYQCICEPEVQVALSGPRGPVRVLPCYACGTVLIGSEGRSQFAFFGAARARFERMREVFGVPSAPAQRGSPTSTKPAQ